MLLAKPWQAEVPIRCKTESRNAWKDRSRPSHAMIIQRADLARMRNLSSLRNSPIPRRNSAFNWAPLPPPSR